MTEALELIRGLKVADLGTHLADDAEWWVMGDPAILPFAGSYRGPEGFAEWLRNIRAAVTYDRFDVIQYIAAGDEVIEIIEAAGTANANGRRYESRVVRIFTVRGGKIVRVQSFFDTAEYAKALHG